jgi:hypothetical protein
MKADIFIHFFIERHQQDGNTVVVNDQGVESEMDHITLKITVPRAPYYLTIYSSSTTQEILFFRMFGEIDFIPTFLNTIRTKGTFYGFEVLKFEYKLGSLLSHSVITVLAVTHMERNDKLTEEDIRAFSEHFPLNRMVGIIKKQDWTQRGIDFLHQELDIKEQYDQYAKEQERDKRDSQFWDDSLNDCRDQARDMGYDV